MLTRVYATEFLAIRKDLLIYILMCSRVYRSLTEYTKYIVYYSTIVTRGMLLVPYLVTSILSSNNYVTHITNKYYILEDT